MSLSLDRSLLKPVVTVVAIVLSLFQIYFTGGFGVTDAHILRGTHLTLIMILVLLLVPSRKLAPGEKEGWFPILIDLALIALAIAINVYVFQEADNISRRLKYVEDVTNLDLFYGTGLVLLVLEATRRTSGWPLVIVSGSFLAYAMFGDTNVQPSEEYQNSCGEWFSDYVEAVRQAGSVWSVPVIDLYAVSGIYPLLESNSQYLNNAQTDRLHLNPKGHSRLGATLVYQLLTLPCTF